MMLKHWGAIPAIAWEKARGAYGDSVDNAYRAAIALVSDTSYLAACLNKMKMDASLQNDITQILTTSLKTPEI